MMDNKIAVSFIVSAGVHALALFPICGAMFNGLYAEKDRAEFMLSIGSLQVGEAPMRSNAAVMQARDERPDDLDDKEEKAVDNRARSDEELLQVRKGMDERAPKQSIAESRLSKTSRPRAIASLPSAGDSGRAAATSGWGKEEYWGAIRRRIAEAKRYPTEALNEGSAGTAIVGFALHRNGSVTDVRIMRSSLSGILDTEAARTIRRAAPFPPVPAKIKGEPLDVRVPISFEIVKR